MSSKARLKFNNFMEEKTGISETVRNQKKPPLPQNVKRKRKASESILSTITNVASPFRSLRKRHHSMGAACTKRSKVSTEMSPMHVGASKRGKVAPSNELQPNNVEDLKPIYKSRLSVDRITLHSNSEINVQEHNNIKKEEQPVVFLEEIDENDDITKDPNKINKRRRENSSSNNSSNTISSDSLSDTDMLKDKHTSLPDLRLKEKSKRVNRSSSQGDTLLKSSIGSANLLSVENKTLLTRRNCYDPRHHSSENVLNVKRTKRLPTVENGVHVLEAHQVNYYQILEEIGRGSFGSVSKCLCHKDNKYYAMKVISKKRLMRKNRMLARHPSSRSNPLEPLQKEIAILKKMDHPNIVKLIEVIDDIQVDNVYMVFELMQDGVVIEVPTKDIISEERSRRLFRDLLLGIEYLHYSKIIHRDIKPTNLLLDKNDHIKIADFGVSNMFEGDDDLLSKYAGSPAFQAPEVLNYDSRDKYSGKAVDVWAMGVTLFCFLYGQCPFFSNNIGELCNMIKTEPVAFPEDPIINPQALDLMSRMLSKQAKNRITVLEMKEHPWVTEGGTNCLPSTEDHCSVIEVTEEEVRNSIKIISKLSSLVLAKSVLRGKSFVGQIRSKAGWKRNHSVPSTSFR